MFGVSLVETDIREFDYFRNGISVEQDKEVLGRFHEDACSSAVPIHDSVAALWQLSRTFSIWVLTARPDSTIVATETWLKEHKFPIDRLIHTREKITLAGEVVAVIEDHRETAHLFAKHGTPAYLFDYPWNRPPPEDPTRVTRVLGWQDVLVALK